MSYLYNTISAKELNKMERRKALPSRCERKSIKRDISNDIIGLISNGMVQMIKNDMISKKSRGY